MQQELRNKYENSQILLVLSSALELAAQHSLGIAAGLWLVKQTNFYILLQPRSWTWWTLSSLHVYGFC